MVRTVVEEGKSLLLILKLSQVETHWIHFSFRCQPEIKIQSPRSRKAHRLLQRQKILTVKSNGGTSPGATIHSHLLVLKVHHDAQGFDDGTSAEKWGLALEQKDLCLAKSAGNAHGKLHHPFAPTFTITSKMKLVPASMELDIVDGVALRLQKLQVSASMSKSTKECRGTWIQHSHIIALMTRS